MSMNGPDSAAANARSNLIRLALVVLAPDTVPSTLVLGRTGLAISPIGLGGTGRAGSGPYSACLGRAYYRVSVLL